MKNMTWPLGVVSVGHRRLQQVVPGRHKAHHVAVVQPLRDQLKKKQRATDKIVEVEFL